MYFCDFVIISTLKRVWPFIWKFKSSSFKDALWQVWLKLARDSGEDFLISSMYFPYFLLSLFGKEDGPSFEQIWIVLPKENLCQIWLNCPSCSREEFIIIFPWKRPWPFIWKNSSLKNALWQVWLKLAQWFWRSWKCDKLTDRRTDHRWSEKFSSFQLRWAKKGRPATF